jgi:hypothetical protein
MARVADTEEWRDAVKKHIDKLKTNDERYEFAHLVIFDIALWTGYNTYEMVGLLEVIKLDLLDDLKTFAGDCDGDCDNCDDDD